MGIAIWRIAFVVIFTGVCGSGARSNEQIQKIEVGSSTRLGGVVSAEEAEAAGTKQYRAFLESARDNDQLLRSDDPRVERVVAVAGKILPNATLFNPRAADWSWEVNVIKSGKVNAFCMPGGKVAIYTGMLDRLELTDDELAAILGHEIAHAVHEHARDRMAAGKLTRYGIRALKALGHSDVTKYARTGANLLTLKFSRDDEIEADLIGMELAAHSGFDPRAAVTLWDKMSGLSKKSEQEFTSSHPTWERRVESIEEHLDVVLPIYEEAIDGGDVERSD